MTDPMDNARDAELRAGCGFGFVTVDDANLCSPAIVSNG
jgi:hypothetical protein